MDNKYDILNNEISFSFSPEKQEITLWDNFFTIALWDNWDNYLSIELFFLNEI